ncbi:helix-turn-helix domain-containing protein [Nocardia sp. NPDC056000]|uniref:helix-turn-helix domain-containing protein n=1 Tax=Nocardia sp. NPDC056000 TaxID=3345674 RepID=UPI0035E07826
MTVRTPNVERAMEVSAFFDGARLTLARHLSGMRKSELAESLARSVSEVSAWESGMARPPASAVAELALGLAIPAEFLMMRPGSIVSTTPHFRSLRSTTQLDRDQAFAYGRLAAEVTSTLESRVEFPRVEVPRITVAIDDLDSAAPERAARSVREAWGLGTAPIRHVVRLVENHGVLVIFGSARTAAVAAYSFEGAHRPIVVLDPNVDDPHRQRFDVAHELGHLVMHCDAEPGHRVAELQADRFAAEFLLPSAQIGDSFATGGAGGLPVDREFGTAVAPVIEQPSLLPRALELLDEIGIHSHHLVEECRVSDADFRTVTARYPVARHVRTPSLRGDSSYADRVVSIADWSHMKGEST